MKNFVREQKMNSGNKKWIYRFLFLAFLSFFLAGILGVTMRFYPFISVSIPFENLLHSHSHTALLGWAFLGCTTGILHCFPIAKKALKNYYYLFFISILGMFFSFLYQGYGLISILFSTLYIFLVYHLFWNLYRKIHTTGTADILLKRSIIWFYISTLGIWILGPSSVILGKEHWLYHTSIRFFLHYQINGWLFYAILGLILKNRQITFNNLWIIRLLDASLILTTFLPLYWVDKNLIFYILNALGILAQFASICLLINILYKSKIIIPKNIITIWLIFIVIKAMSQLPTLLPSFAEELKLNRSLILTYLHWVLLGIVSFGLILNYLDTKIIRNTPLFKFSFYTLLVGFLATEAILFCLGNHIYLRHNTVLMAIFSIFLLIGITGFLWKIYRRNII
ncbi:NnrS protein [Candidatus Ornithobacterium hominis]|uniref:hypothetical protein n=1 Tax=Candidatus Ornithobacterium hominis TaxID=2497989 RepID=UPI0024BC6132|nr:hypothetical protein [Candidatus Ornithobacterium hominis]CAI9430449.1 NnrS protein [Candidatus Ornithobacterium hominis]